ncbi:hypothetical protein F5B20DRAFT_583110 [Whalleya microplaca]|nr:hypothetical protein F5B20DRAFT_583110 [Whalleya microplaca]
MVVLLRLLYLLSPGRRAGLHLTANILSLNVFLFSVGPNYIYPLIRGDQKLVLTSLSWLESGNLFFTVAAAILIPVTTPSHHIIPEDGSIPHPSATCSPGTRWWTYGWVSPFIMLGYRQRGALNVDDLPPLRSGSQPHLWFEAFKMARLRTTSTGRALWKLFCPRLLVMAFMMVLCGFAEFLGVIGLRSLLQYLQGSPKQALVQPWFSALLFGISPVVRGLCMQTFESFSTQNICYLKGMVIYTIYRKLLQQPPGCHPDLGQVTNHVAADVDKIAMLRYTIMAGFMVPVEVAVASVLLYQTIGWSYVPGLLVILITRIPISWYVSRYQKLAQSHVMTTIDSRVRRVSEVVNGLQTIKTLGQSFAFCRWVNEKREAELEAIWKKLIIVTASETISSASVLVPLVMSLSIFALGAGMPVTPAVLFTVLSIFSTLKSMLSLAVTGTSAFAQTSVSLGRVVGFLDEDSTFLLKDGQTGVFSDLDQAASSNVFGAENAIIGLPSSDGSVNPILSNVNLELIRGQLNLITGKTGSGKSILLKALLSELPLISGKMQMRSHPSETISYAGQSPWLLRGTIRENILFNSPFSIRRYNKVVKAVCLEADLQAIPGGDLADVGEAGSSLSGGQRSRVALARALYADTKTVVLDDVLAALDATTTNWIIKNCIFGSILKDRTVVLASENMVCREAARLVVEVQNGTVRTIISKPKEAGLTALPKIQDIQIVECEIISEELSLPEGSDSPPQTTKPAVVSKVIETKAGGSETTTALNGWLIVLKYLRLFGSPGFLVVLCFVILVVHSLDLASSFWLTIWSGESEGAIVGIGRSRTAFYIIIYASLCVSQLVLATLSSLIFFRGGLKASNTQHAKILGSVLGATFNWVTNTPAGQMINRFSSDMFSLDNTVIELMKQVVENYLSIGFRLVAVASLLPMFLLPTLGILAIGLYTGKIYIYGSTASKKLYAASLSPLLTSISDAITGISVIRAHRAEYSFQNRFTQALEQYLRGWEAVSASQRWLAVRMDLCAGSISLSTATLALLSRSASPAKVGFSMTSSSTLCTALLYVVYLSSLLEVEMTSFQRIEEYIHKVPQEPSVVARAPASPTPDNWPSEGHLVVQKLTAGYSLDSDPVLEDINFDVRPGKRIAIVGRTGSGKSSLVASILRLLMKFRGNVVLDGINLDFIEAERLRQAISFIPQRPTLFEGPLRFNLDFGGAVSDADLRRIVVDVIGHGTEANPDWVLDRHIEANGRNLSQGECQLVALSRALVTDARIVIIDEATASLDEDYEQRIQQLLRDKFAHKSLIAIAHRLSTIIDFDEVLVMEQGHVVERGNPRSLCSASNLSCEGYGNKIAFKDQTFSVTQRFSAKDDGSKRRRLQAPEKAVSKTEPQAEPVAMSGPSLSNAYGDYTTSPVQLDGTPQVLSGTEEWPWPDWALTELPRTDEQQLQLFGDSPSSIQGSSLFPTDDSVYSGVNVGAVNDQLVYTPVSLPLPTYDHSISKYFQFPEDAAYYKRLLDDQVRGLATILPLREFIANERLSTPHLLSAALAVSALTLSANDGTPPTTKQHALRHYTIALQSHQENFPDLNPGTFENTSLDALLSWFLTRLLLANFDLRWGSLAAWRAHLRAAGKILSAYHGRFSSSTTGRKLTHAFARMALLVELQNEDFAVTKMQTMNPAIADELSAMLECSDAPRDRLLFLIREVTKLEIKYRSQPGLDQKWAKKMEVIEAQLASWQRCLPSSELPVDTGLNGPIAFYNDVQSCSSSSSSPLHITPLTFPNSSDPYIAAVNYAHFLCARMRARTRYVEDAGRVTPTDTETTVLHICRIAAGVAPEGCAQADAFGHGMMPAIVGAHRWTADARVRNWVVGWLRGYDRQGPREGIWNVCQARRLLTFMEAERTRRRKTERGWDIIAARIEEDEDSLDEEGSVWEKVVRRGSECSQGSGVAFNTGPHISEKELAKDTGPFKVVVHSKNLGSLSTDYCVVP